MTRKVCILLSSIWLLFCCTSNTELPEITDTNEVEEVKPRSFSFLALGDSYTIGQGVQPKESWPFQLKDALENSERTINELTIIARTGWTTSDLLQAIAQQSPTKQDMVSLSIGVNNQFRGLEFSIFQEEFNTLLDIAIDLAESKEKVFVVSIPDYGVTPFGAYNSENIARELDMYNTYMKQRCAEINIAFIDITPISRELGDGSNALADDNLHPSPFQYSLWVEEILPVANAILK